jgi:hypothetical protein
MKIDFEVDTEYGLYRDALYFPDGEPLPDDATIDAMKTERVNNWVTFINSPPPSLVDENGNPLPLDEFGNPIRG